jgi:protein FAM50
MNQTLGPNKRRLFEYSSQPPENPEPTTDAVDLDNLDNYNPLSRPSAKPKPPASAITAAADLEGAADDPAFTKVVDRRWYERNKHIFPASVWQEFDPEKDYQSEVKRDVGGNAFFFS